MVQMTPADQAVVKAIPGNKQCADCTQKNPQWASVSFGTVFCLECSGVHRSLGVHITFVRSIAMDSWTPQQLALMKAGGNGKCKDYLTSHGVPPAAAIKEKYEHPAAQLYKEVLKARVEGRPEPTQLPKPKARMPSAPSSGNSMGSMGGGGAAAAKGSNDPNGMERLTGESEAQYVARQTRLREEAKARMAAKFGGGGGAGMGSMAMGGSQRMGGVGSDPNYNPNGGGGVTDSLVSGFGAAFGALGSVATSAATQASAVYNDPNTQRSVAGLTTSVTSTGAGLWGSLTSSVTQVASTLVQPDEGDALGDLQRQMASQKTGKYSGFGSNNPNALVGGGGSAHMSHASSGSSMGGGVSSGAATPAPGMPNEDPNGLAKLTGESDEQYIARQTRIREEAKARMAAKFGTGTPTMTSQASSSFGHAKPTTSAPSNGNLGSAQKLKADGGDDFFSSFGA